MDLGRDRDLVARYQNGDPGAFDDLYRRYFERLRRFCQRHTSDPHEAEEIAQEAFVKALRSMHSLQGERRFYPWMTVIAKRVLIDRHRKLSRVEVTDDVDTGSVEPEIDHLFDEVDAEQVRAAMANLGPRHRDVLMMREARSMSYADIAGDLGVPVTTVEALLHRARKALRREYAVVSGESRGLWGLPVFGWLADRAAALRARVDQRWVEVTAVAAPVAVGAATAAVVLLPGPPAEAPVEAAAPATTVAEVVEASAPTPPDLVFDPVTVPPVALPTSSTTTTAPAPSVDAGPVDVYLGPEGTATAKQKAEDMPVNRSLGPASGGLDGASAGDDMREFVEDTVEFVFGVEPDDAETKESQPLLGGQP